MGTTPSQIEATQTTTSKSPTSKLKPSSSRERQRKNNPNKGYPTTGNLRHDNSDEQNLSNIDEMNGNIASINSSKGKSKNSSHKINSMENDYGRLNNVGLLIDSPAGTADGTENPQPPQPPSLPAVAPPNSTVPDSNVTVNLAMADLMAYLQVVANNSSNLPLTRRDDPELGRTVSNLTADDYAKKCAAFIPSDVRIISGSFTKYGRVWDLPTSEEFVPSDATQEPGLSYGGACGNALLKVLYDLESEVNDDANTVDYTTTANLFDDDEEEEEEGDGKHGLIGEAKSFESIVLSYDTSQNSITWSDLLRRMKEEIQSIGYCQAPFITSSRKFDINQPFRVVPDDFDHTKNKKRSLLIGCNYKEIPEANLKASHDDIRSMKDFIVNVHGFPEAQGHMTVLLDDDKHIQPTHLNITEAFKSLSEQSQPGDAVFVYFSGHGCRVLDAPLDTDVESYDEALIPSDFHSSGMIRDTLIFKTLLAPMRHGVTVTILIDCCDTGMVLDLPYCWSTKNDRGDVPPKMTLNDDFSFVRFLKVIKTLYESSMFTQLGQTVGSAIYGNSNMPARDLLSVDEHSQTDESFGAGSLVTMDENDTVENKATASKSKITESLMSLLNACQSRNSPGEKIRENFSDATNNEESGRASILDPSNLFQQVMSCTLLNNPAESDDDSYHRQDLYPSFDETDDDYDSYTEDDGPLHGREYARRANRKGSRRRMK